MFRVQERCVRLQVIAAASESTVASGASGIIRAYPFMLTFCKHASSGKSCMGGRSFKYCTCVSVSRLSEFQDMLACVGMHMRSDESQNADRSDQQFEGTGAARVLEGRRGT